MAPSLAVRITAPFSDLSGIVRAWALKADKLVAYEHTGDATEKVHIHLLMLGVSCDKERLKQIAKEVRPVIGNGNGYWSFKTKIKGGIDVSPENSDRFITYMSKGFIDASYNKGFDESYLQRMKAEWTTVAPAREQVLYFAFIDYLRYKKNNDYEDVFAKGSDLIDTHENVLLLKSWARSWAFAYHKSFWTVRTATDAKMVFLTHCMRSNLTIPQDVKYW